jgi:hypothetical protein
MSVLFHEFDWLLKIIVRSIDWLKNIFGIGSTTEYNWLNQQVESLFRKRYEQKVEKKLIEN